jgi:glutaminase
VSERTTDHRPARPTGDGSSSEDPTGRPGDLHGVHDPAAAPEADLDEIDIDAVLEEVAALARPYADEGEVADYIPPLADVDPHRFGLAIVEMDGTEHVVGDVDVALPIQSISKVFSLVLAMQKAAAAEGVEKELWQRCGVEPSGDPFNSLVQLERERGIPRNPMINAGALVVDDVLLDHCDDVHGSTLALLSQVAGEPVEVDRTVLDAESDSSGRNDAIAHLMSSFGNLRHDVADVLDAYVFACAVAMTPRQLARASRFLANDGVDPGSGERILSAAHARRVAAIMLTCGTYDAAGEFAFEVGLPCKSGVAGAIVALVPDRMAICVWSPPLEDSGNSVAGRVALKELSERLGLTIF